MRIGWWTLLGFLSLGAGLELMHGLKLGWYLDVSNETRRLMFTLAHTHGTLLGLLHVAFGLSVRAMPGFGARARATAAACLGGATLLLPLGFLLGGLFTHAGDPGVGVFLVPPGAALLFVAVFLTARGAKP